MIARWLLVAMFLCLAVSPVVADIWSPSTWMSQGSKQKNVSVSKSNKKSSSKSSGVTGHKAIQGLTSAPHDFLTKTKSIISPGKSSKSKKSQLNKSTQSKDQKPSMFKSMFSPEPPPPPQTVKEA